MRLDELLVDRGLCLDLHEAQALIIAGEVVVGEHRAQSAGLQVKPDTSVRLKINKHNCPYVSRGGLKLEHALDQFNVDVVGSNCVDLGASSGGFTDCLLQRGAKHVSAVDVGFGQFDWTLRNDLRVSLYERTNIRNVSADDIEGPFDLAVADLSFISLVTVMNDIASLLTSDGVCISLIKPQFEASREQIEEGGIVTSLDVHKQSIQNVLDSAAGAGFEVCALTYSPIKGPAGNIEFLFWAKLTNEISDRESSISNDDISRVVHEAHATLRSNS